VVAAQCTAALEMSAQPRSLVSHPHGVDKTIDTIDNSNAGIHSEHREQLRALRTSEKKRVAVCASRWSHVRLGTRLRTPVWRAHVEVMPHVRGGTVHPVYRRWLPRNWHSQDQLGVNMREGLKSTSSIRLPRSGQSVPLMFSFDFGFRNCSICISFADLVSVFPLSVHPFGVCLPFSVLSVVSSIR